MIPPRSTRLCIAIALSLACADSQATPRGTSAASAPEEIAGPATVIDRDTIEIRGTRIRLHGIDAPESGQLCIGASGRTWRCGQQAALALAERIGRARVVCRHPESGEVLPTFGHHHDRRGRGSPQDSRPDAGGAGS